VDPPRRRALARARHRSADVYPTLKQQREAAEDAAFAAKIAASRRFLAAIRAEVDELKAALARRRPLAKQADGGHI
jgi:hypothetical protein